MSAFMCEAERAKKVTVQVHQEEDNLHAITSSESNSDESNSHFHNNSAFLSSTSPSQHILSSLSEEYRYSPLNILGSAASFYSQQQDGVALSPREPSRHYTSSTSTSTTTDKFRQNMLSVLQAPPYLDYFCKAPVDVTLGDLPACNRLENNLVGRIQ